MSSTNKPQGLIWSLTRENTYTTFHFENGSQFKRNNHQTTALFKTPANSRFHLKENNNWEPAIRLKELNGKIIAVSQPNIHYKAKGHIAIKTMKYYWNWLDNSLGHHVIFNNKKEKLIELILEKISNGIEFSINYYTSYLTDKNKDVILALGMFHFTPALIANEL